MAGSAGAAGERRRFRVARLTEWRARCVLDARCDLGALQSGHPPAMGRRRCDPPQLPQCESGTPPTLNRVVYVSVAAMALPLQLRSTFLDYHLLRTHFTLYFTHTMALSAMKTNIPEPLGGPPPAEFALAGAPLERVIAQVKFPLILRIEDKTAASTFQEAIRADYPILRQLQGHTLQIQVGPGGPIAMPGSTVSWQFTNADNTWKIILARDALTIETLSYQSRADFLMRWVKVMQAVEDVFHPALTERLGVRYVDRISGEHFPSFDLLIKKEFLGSALASLKSHLRHSLNEASFSVEEGELLLRWGVMAAGMSPDPGAISPLAEESFVLDIDVWSSVQQKFESNDLSAAFQKLAERAYSVFRFAVTDEFLKVYGS
jgi:uncharacterized protein (TIGR04255 family)